MREKDELGEKLFRFLKEEADREKEEARRAALDMPPDGKSPEEMYEELAERLAKEPKKER